MSNIDERVVSMQFDNKQFEQGAQTSMSTLDKLKQKLSMADATEGFSELGKIANKLDFSGISDGIETVTARFSAFQSFVHGIFASLGADAYNFGKNLVNSLTFDQVSAGWSKYEEMATSVATIIAATGQSQDAVYNDLDKLNWFADETSYSLTQMTGAYSKFASAGIEADEAMTAIMGLATASSRAGISAGDSRFNSVLYNVSQAMGTGYLGMMDWKSLELAGIATKEFKQQLIDAGVAAGQLVQQGDKYYTTAKHTEVTAESLRDTLSEKWVDKDVMLSAFGEYGSFVDQIYEYATDKGITAEKAMEDLADAEGELGYQAFRSAQETKTFGEAIEGTADAVSTLWMKIFQDIFGNYEEAKELWTSFGEVLYEKFAEPLWDVLDVLDVWKKYGGRTNLLEGLSNGFEILTSVVNAAKAAFQGLFPEIKGGALAVASRKFKEWTESMKPTQETLDKITSSFKGVAAIVKLGITVFSKLFGVVKSFFSAFSGSSSTLLNVTATFGEFVSNLVDAIIQSEKFNRVFDTLGAVAARVGGIIQSVVRVMWAAFQVSGGGIEGVIKAIISGLGHLGEEVITAIEDITGWDLSGYIEGLGRIIGFVWDKVGKFFDLFSGKNADLTPLETIKKLFSDIGDAAGTVVEKIGSFFKDVVFGATGFLDSVDLTSIGGFLKTIGGWVSGAGSKLWQLIKDIGGELANLDFSEVVNLFAGIGVGGAGIGIFALAEKIKGFIDSLTGAKEKSGGLSDFLGGIKDSLTDFSESLTKSVKVSMIVEVALALIVLAGAMKMISSIDPGRLSDSLLVVSALLGEIVITLKSLSKLDIKGNLKKAATGMLLMSAAVYVLAAAMKSLSGLSTDQLANGMLTVTALLAELVAVTRLAKPQDLVKTGVGLMAIALSVKILASTFKTFASMKWEELGKGAAAVGALLVALGAFTRIAKGKSLIGTGLGLIAVAAALKILVGVAKSFSEMKWEELGKAGAAISVLLAVLGGFSRIAKGGTLIAAGLGMIAIAAALKIIASAAATFAEMNWEQLGKAGAAISGILLAIGAFSAVISNFGGGGAGFVAMGVGLIAVGAGLKIVASVVSQMASLSWDDLTKGLVGLGGILAELAVTLMLVQGTLGGAASLLLIAVALNALIIPVMAFKSMSWGEIAKSLIMFAGALGILIAAGALATVVAPGLLILGAALTMIGAGMIAAGVGIMAFSAGIAALAALGSGSIEIILLALQAIITTVLTMLPTIASALAASIVTFIKTLADGASTILQSVVQLGSTILSAIIELLPQILEVISMILAGIIPIIIEYTPQIVETVLLILTELIAGLSEKIPEIVGLVIDMITSLLETIAQKLPDFIQAGVDIVVAFMQGLGSAIPQLIDAGFKMIIDFINGLADAIRNNTEPLLDAIDNLIWAMIDAGVAVLTHAAGNFLAAGQALMDSGLIQGIADKVGSFLETIGSFIADGVTAVIDTVGDWISSGVEIIGGIIEGIANSVESFIGAVGDFIGKGVQAVKDTVTQWFNVGIDLIQGFINGVGSMASAVIDAVTGLFSDAVNSVLGFLGIKSPSRLFAGIGRYVDEGFIEGIEDYSGKVANTTRGMAENATGAFQSVIDDGISFDDFADPTIRPVMDLTEIQNGMVSMNDMLGGYNPTISGTFDASQVNTRQSAYDSMLNDIRALLGQKDQTTTVTNNNTFNITNEDPIETANQVSRIIQQQINRKESAWA